RNKENVANPPSLPFLAHLCCPSDTFRWLSLVCHPSLKRILKNLFLDVRLLFPLFIRYYEMYKSPMELKKEQCESYIPCDYYSELVGFHAAYRRFFGNV
uniref:Gla domain-containing protein n=1 Tax=Varanus komodoensis TaxID=61221 RepID=A0A8D2KZB5_VARKO